MEIPLLVSKQLKNVMELIELNPNILFKELDSFISDPVVDCFEVAKNNQDDEVYYNQYSR